MNTLWSVFAISMGLAYLSEKKVLCLRYMKNRRIDIALVALIVLLSFFCGLRTSYNDTHAYIVGFNNAPTPSEYLATNPTLFDNPAFYLIQSFFRHYISDNYHLFFVVVAFVTITPFIVFIKKYAVDFSFSFFLFFVLIYLFPFAAVKQALAMAILCSATEKLIEKKYLLYFFLVFLAMLFHTYSFLFFILPLFRCKPWSKLTYVSIALIIIVLMSFESVIYYLFNITDGLGKDLEAVALLSQKGMNIFRVAVYAVAPVFSWLFKKRISPNIDDVYSLMINMSIISFLIVILGSVYAANMFGRLANYFILGTILCLPWILRSIFDMKSYHIVRNIAYACYLIFFYLDTRNFVAEYRAITVIEFIKSILN